MALYGPIWPYGPISSSAVAPYGAVRPWMDLCGAMALYIPLWTYMVPIWPYRDLYGSMAPYDPIETYMELYGPMWLYNPIQPHMALHAPAWPCSLIWTSMAP